MSGPQGPQRKDLARGYGNLAAAAGDSHALSDGERRAALFLHHHDGVAIIFANFQLNALVLFIAPWTP